MTKGAGITSGHRRRPLALLLASLSLVALTAAGAPPASGSRVAVQRTQELAALLSSHRIRAAPSAKSPLLGDVPALTPITHDRTVLPVLAHHGNWLKVRLPGRPNSHTGWITRKATLQWSTSWHLVVNRARRQVAVYRSGRLVRVFKAVVGKPSTPTPPGEFFVEESIALRSYDVGAPFALALSARSKVLQEFDGGPGQIALHGLSNVGGVPGTAASHGCIRLADAVMRWLVVRVGPGTPVTITG
ncbi:MAG TPA: L,D-transpeptidase family protein [Gaiellaceae bacterium]